MLVRVQLYKDKPSGYDGKGAPNRSYERITRGAPTDQRKHYYTYAPGDQGAKSINAAAGYANLLAWRRKGEKGVRGRRRCGRIAVLDFPRVKSAARSASRRPPCASLDTGDLRFLKVQTQERAKPSALVYRGFNFNPICAFHTHRDCVKVSINLVHYERFGILRLCRISLCTTYTESEQGEHPSVMTESRVIGTFHGSGSIHCRTYVFRHHAIYVFTKERPVIDGIRYLNTAGPATSRTLISDILLN